MRKTILAAALLLIGAAACKKEYYTQTVNANGNQNNSTLAYKVSGLQDLTLQKRDSGSNSVFMPITLEYISKSQERLRLSIAGAPAGLFDSLTVKSGYPTFQSMVVLADSGVATGNYTMKLVVTGDSSGKREFPFDLTVTPPRDCSSDLIDSNYSTNSPCASSTSYMQNIMRTTTRNRIMFSNINGSGGQIYADINCDNQTLTIPTQTVGTVTFSGNGNYSVSFGSKFVQLNVMVSATGGSIPCTVTLIK
jgi:hypothetical protein